jgi:hypothetical protein
VSRFSRISQPADQPPSAVITSARRFIAGKPADESRDFRLGHSSCSGRPRTSCAIPHSLRGAAADELICGDLSSRYRPMIGRSECRASCPRHRPRRDRLSPPSCICLVVAPQRGPTTVPLMTAKSRLEPPDAALDAQCPRCVCYAPAGRATEHGRGAKPDAGERQQRPCANHPREEFDNRLHLESPRKPRWFRHLHGPFRPFVASTLDEMAEQTQGRWTSVAGLGGPVDRVDPQRGNASTHFADQWHCRAAVWRDDD